MIIEDTESFENGLVSNYCYDAESERTVKTSGENEAIYVNYRASRVQCQVCLSIAEAQPIITESNSEFSGGNTGTARFSLYVSPYLVAGQGGKYTKHIYIGSQRIVSKLGDLASYGADPRRISYAGNEADGLTINYKDKYAKQLQSIKDNYKAFDQPYNGKDNDDYVNGQVCLKDIVGCTRESLSKLTFLSFARQFCCNDGTPEAAQARVRTRAASGNFKENDEYEKMQFYYHPDHLGSSSYITNLDGEVAQHIEYVPFGEVFIEERNNTWNTPYLFNAKELDEETGMYYYGARYYEPRISLWMSTDPLQEKYENISPYIYCANSPIRYTDPKGMEVEADKLSMKNISYTLTKQEAKYVRFDKNGVLDKKRLNKSKSTSENMTALKALANSEIVYSFQVADKDHNNVGYYDNSATGGNYYRGTTEMPNAKSNPSPDDKVYILVGRALNEKQQVKTTAHEAFGHAYIYEKTRNVEQASHTYKSEGHTIWDEEFQMDVFESIKIPTNTILENQINKVVKQAEENYDKRNKK